MLYILLFAAFYSLYRKTTGGGGVFLLLPAIFIHIGTSFGPVVSLRYYFASFLSVPAAIALVLSQDLCDGEKYR